MNENKINCLLDPQYVEALLKKRIDLGIRLLEIKPIKNNVWLTTYHVVFRYKVRFELSGDEKHIYVTAHDSEQRENVINSLKFLANNGFEDGGLIAPKALFYEPEFNASFYEGLNGNNLYFYIKANEQDQIKRIIKQTAAWFAKLHSLEVPSGVKFNNEHGRLKTVVPGVENVLESVNINFPEYISAYDRLYMHFMEQEDENLKSIKQTIIHGDAHPENVIRIDSETVGLIDFVDMTVADPARDIGSFLQQLEYMCMRKIDDLEFIVEVKDLFLTTYAENAKILLNESFENRIELYFNWTAMRTATFFLMKHNPEPERAAPLISGALERLKLKV